MGYSAGAAAPGYGQYQAMAAQGGMMGAMIAPQMGMVAQPGVMPHQAGMGAQVPNPYMAGVQGGMMGGVAAVPPQQPYGAQQAQQLQWNIAQVSRDTASLVGLASSLLSLSSSPFFLPCFGYFS